MESWREKNWNVLVLPHRTRVTLTLNLNSVVSVFRRFKSHIFKFADNAWERGISAGLWRAFELRPTKSLVDSKTLRMHELTILPAALSGRRDASLEGVGMEVSEPTKQTTEPGFDELESLSFCSWAARSVTKMFPEPTVPSQKESDEGGLNTSSLESGGSLGLSDLGFIFIPFVVSGLPVYEFELELWTDATKSPTRLFRGRAGWEGVGEMVPVDFYHFRGLILGVTTVGQESTNKSPMNATTVCRKESTRVGRWVEGNKWVTPSDVAVQNSLRTLTISTKFCALKATTLPTMPG